MDENSFSYLVGIGASAGGLEALTTLLPHLPVDRGFSYVIVHHLDPKHKSLLSGLLERNTQMRVKEIKHGDKILPNRIYVTPPNSNLVLKNNRFHLTPPAEIGPKPSIDLFFRYLAESVGENAVGIVLSGTGSDGSNGIRALKASGSLTFAQKVESAKFGGMPQAAINTGCVDIVASPEEIGRRIPEVIDHSFKVTHDKGYQSVDYQKICQELYRRTGVNFQDYKPATIWRRINRRMSVLNLLDLTEYLQYLRENHSEAGNLYRDLLISVTSFFRNPEVFAALRKQLNEFLESRPNQNKLRFWAPACATGEEVYSLAILLHQILGERVREYSIQVFGTDLDSDAIEKARMGKYSLQSVEMLDKSILNQYFVKAADHYQINSEIREMVLFSRHDLIEEPPFSKMDLVACRNLLIYFSEKLQSRVLNIFHYALNDNGILLLGKSESVTSASGLFVIVDKQMKIYRKRKVHRSFNSGIQLGSSRYPFKPDPPNVKEEKPAEFKTVLNQALVDSLDLCGLVMNSSNSLLHVVGDIDKYMNIKQGTFSNNVLNLIHPELRLDLRMVSGKCLKLNAMQKSRSIVFEREGQSHKVTIIAYPLVLDQENDTCLITFREDNLITTSGKTGGSGKKVKDDRVRELEHELTTSKEHLSSVTEELEANNEELQSLTEELQSSNEELQSSNEELETSNEELQSTNEELTTVNDELNSKSMQLSETLQDFENLLELVQFGVIVVDENLKIVRSNAAILQFLSREVAREDEYLTALPFIFPTPDIRQEINEVIKYNKETSEEIAIENMVIWKRIVPFQKMETNNRKGCLIALLNITEQRQNQKELYEHKELMDSVFQCMSDAALLVSKNQDVLFYNQELVDLLGEKTAESFNDIVGRLKVLKNDNLVPLNFKDNPFVKVLDGKKSPKSTPVYCITDQDGREQYFNINVKPLVHPDKKVRGAVGVFQNVTETIENEKSLKLRLELESTFSRAAYSLVHLKSGELGLVIDQTLKDVSKAISARQAIMVSLSTGKETRVFEWVENPADGKRQWLEELSNHQFQSSEAFSISDSDQVVGIEGKTLSLGTCQWKVEDGWKNIILIPKFKGDNLDRLLMMFWKNEDPFPGLENIQISLSYFADALQNSVDKEKSRQELNEKITELHRSNADLERFAYVASHDLKEPLRSVYGYLGLFRKKYEDTLDDAARGYIEKAIHGSERLQQMISDLLQFARLTTAPEPSGQVDLNDILKQALDLLQSDIAATNAKISQNNLPMVIGSQSQLIRLFQNLIGNALKFYKDDHPVVHIEAKTQQDKVLIEVSDQGIGIEKQYAENIFQIFTRLHKRNEFSGSGMGLAICKKIVELHNGSIWFDSEIGKGTKFYITLPFA